jgi:hypothetical protein
MSTGLSKFNYPGCAQMQGQQLRIGLTGVVLQWIAMSTSSCDLNISNDDDTLSYQTSIIDNTSGATVYQGNIEPLANANAPVNMISNRQFMAIAQ